MSKFNPEKARQFLEGNNTAAPKEPNGVASIKPTSQKVDAPSSASTPAAPVAARPDTVPTPSVPATPVTAPVAAAPTIQQPEQAPFTNGQLFHYLLQRAQHPDVLFTASDVQIKWGLTDDQTRRLLADLRAAHILEVDNKIKNESNIREIVKNMPDTSLQEKYTFPGDDHPSLTTPHPVAPPTPVIKPIKPTNPQPIAAPIPPVAPAQPAAPAASPSPAAAPAAPAAAPANQTGTPDHAQANAATKTRFQKLQEWAGGNKMMLAAILFSGAVAGGKATLNLGNFQKKGVPSTVQTAPPANQEQSGSAPSRVLNVSQSTAPTTENLEVPPTYKNTVWYAQLDTERKNNIDNILAHHDAYDFAKPYFKTVFIKGSGKQKELSDKEWRELYDYLNREEFVKNLLLTIEQQGPGFTVPLDVLDRTVTNAGGFLPQPNIKQLLGSYKNLLGYGQPLPEGTMKELHQKVRAKIIQEAQKEAQATKK